MSFKLKLVGVILLIVLIVPVFFSLRDDSSVLGINEGLQDISSSGQIGSGASDYSEQEDETKSYRGLALWEKDLNVEAKSDKFSLGSSITITSSTGKVNAVIGDDKVDLSKEVVVIVNQDLFEQLGGDLQESTSIEVEIVKE